MGYSMVYHSKATDGAWVTEIVKLPKMLEKLGSIFVEVTRRFFRRIGQISEDILFKQQSTFSESRDLFFINKQGGRMWWASTDVDKKNHRRSQGGGSWGARDPPFLSLLVSKQLTIFRWQSDEYPLYESVCPPLWKILATPMKRIEGMIHYVQLFSTDLVRRSSTATRI